MIYIFRQLLQRFWAVGAIGVTFLAIGPAPKARLLLSAAMAFGPRLRFWIMLTQRRVGRLHAGVCVIVFEVLANNR